MLKPSVIDNILNRNTSRRAPAVIYDPAERRARLAAQVDTLAKRIGFYDPCDINDLVRRAMTYLEQGNSPATALDETRKCAESKLKQQSFTVTA